MTQHGWPLNLFNRYTLVPALILLLAGCASSPHTRVRQICPACELVELNRDTDLPLTAYYRPAVGRNGDALHVYLEGDGVPWQFNRPTTNPTSRKMAALRLMQLDMAQSLYLNRPCYGFGKPPPACHPDDWTFGRYSENVVSQLNTAIDEFTSTKNPPLILFGYSGGGTLAMLLAARRTDVTGIVTIAANLDHQSWSDHHGYLPLHNSLNAARQPILPPHVFRWHLAGEKDTQVPADLIQATVKEDPHADYLPYPDFNHKCCWHDIWPTLLDRIAQRRAATGTK